MKRMLIALLTVSLALVACSEDSDSLPFMPEAVSLNYDLGSLGEADEAPPSETASGNNDEVMPSTNQANFDNGWAHVTWNAVDAGVGIAPLKFTSSRSFASCFEYRVDDADATDPSNFNTDIADGLWPFVCVNNSTATRELTANSHVDVRMVFGAETDERFDWTRFYVMTEASKDDCKDGGWQDQGFRNQGQCIRFVETGKDSR